MELEDRLLYFRPVQPDSQGFKHDPSFVELQFLPGPDINEFKFFCSLLAKELGYDEKSVSEAFGKPKKSIVNGLSVKLLKYDKK